MSQPSSSKPVKGYGNHSKMYWVLVYLAIAVIVYGLIYLLFIHKSGGGGAGFKY